MIAMVVASANSFSPSQKTHLATRLAPQAPLRVMPAMKIKSDSWLYVLGLPGFPSQYAKDEERHQVRPYHCARLAPLALAQPFRMHGLLPHAHRPPLSPRLSLEPCAPAPLAPRLLSPCAPGAPRLLAPLASLGPSPPWDPRLPGTLASLGPSPPWAPIPSLEPHASTGARPCHLRRHQHDYIPASPPRPRLRRRMHDRLIIPSFSPPMCLPFLPPCSSSGECGRVYFMFAHCDAGDDSS